MSSIAKVSPEASRVDALLPPRLPEFDSSPPSSARGRLLPHVATAVRQDTARLFAGLFVLSDGIFFASLLGMFAVAHA
jgi:hypothetical protein